MLRLEGCEKLCCGQRELPEQRPSCVGKMTILGKGRCIQDEAERGGQREMRESDKTVTQLPREDRV